jgi:hypothetical protein
MQPHMSRRCPICNAAPLQPCTVVFPGERAGISHYDRMYPPHAIHVFWHKWDGMPGAFGPIRFFKAVGQVKEYYRNLDR